MRAFFAAVMIGCVLLSTGLAADVEFKIVTLKGVNDAREIAVMRDELFLGTETIDRVLIADLLNDGFDQNDIVQLYPSGRVLRLAPITPRLDSLLRGYRLPPNVEIHESRQYFSRYDSLARERSGGQALGYGLLAGIGERLGQGYRGDLVEGYFRFGAMGNSILAWNFDSSRVGFPPLLGPRTDTVRIFLHDTVHVPEIITVTTEPVVTHDTVYIPSELLRKPRGMYYRFALGMFGGGYSMSHRESSRGHLALGAGNEWDFGVWDPWISGRQDIHSRIGLRFVADMAPWKSDTLSPRFLATSFETMYIPAWDRNVFVFGGLRAFYHDDLFWDRTRAAWDDDLYKEPADEKLAHYEMTVKFGLDKFAPYGSGKRFGAWLKLSGWIPGGNKSGYDVQKPLGPESQEYWKWEHSGGTEIEAALTARLSESAQMMISAGQVAIANLHYDLTAVRTDGSEAAVLDSGLVGVQQVYQTAALRFAPYNSTDTRVMLEASFRNNTLLKKIKQGDDSRLKDSFFPYIETPEVAASVQLDVSVIRFNAGARYFFPPKGLDPQLRPEASLYFMFR